MAANAFSIETAGISSQVSPRQHSSIAPTTAGCRSLKCHRTIGAPSTGILPFLSTRKVTLTLRYGTTPSPLKSAWKLRGRPPTENSCGTNEFHKLKGTTKDKVCKDNVGDAFRRPLHFSIKESALFDDSSVASIAGHLDLYLSAAVYLLLHNVVMHRLITCIGSIDESFQLESAA